jgi:hypothetical protein
VYICNLHIYMYIYTCVCVFVCVCVCVCVCGCGCGCVCVYQSASLDAQGADQEANESAGAVGQCESLLGAAGGGGVSSHPRKQVAGAATTATTPAPHSQGVPMLMERTEADLRTAGTPLAGAVRKELPGIEVWGGRGGGLVAGFGGGRRYCRQEVLVACAALRCGMYACIYVYMYVYICMYIYIYIYIYIYTHTHTHTHTHIDIDIDIDITS